MEMLLFLQDTPPLLATAGVWVKNSQSSYSLVYVIFVNTEK